MLIKVRAAPLESLEGCFELLFLDVLGSGGGGILGGFLV